MHWPILSDSADLAVEFARIAQVLDLAVAPCAEPRWADVAAQRLQESPTALLLSGTPSLTPLINLAQHASQHRQRLSVAWLGGDGEHGQRLEALSDLGVVLVRELRPLAALVALMQAGATHPYAANLRALSSIDRERLKASVTASQRDAGELLRTDDFLIAWRAQPRKAARPLGDLPEVAEALRAWRDTAAPGARMASTVEGVDPQSVLDVILGPARDLSDPASKAALLPYGVPLPLEELCASASRAAAEAARIGFPVRLTLTSPDLRSWDHPDLTCDMIDSAAAVRDAYRSLMLLAQSRSPQARLLGVTVTATTHAQALLRATLRPATADTVQVRLGFADPHGLAAGDSTWLVLPGPLQRIERALGRLAGRALVLDAKPAQRQRHLEAIGDVLLRTAAFVHDHRQAIGAVELRPLALLADGSVEVREACVTVNDAFERSLSGSLAASDSLTP